MDDTSGHQRDISMRHSLLLASAFLLYVGPASAEDSAPKVAPAETAAKPSDAARAMPLAAVDMQQVAVGDHWSYDLTDEISGTVKRSETVTITEISSKDITARTEIAGSDKVGIIVYDPAWNVIQSGSQRFSPNDGSGVRPPLELNKSWKIESDRIDSSGGVWKKIGESRIVRKENISVKAGQFEAFVIETKFSAQNTNDRSRRTDATVQTWYSPDLDHWVKRSTVFRVNGHVLQNYVVELTGYGRRKS